MGRTMSARPRRLCYPVAAAAAVLSLASCTEGKTVASPPPNEMTRLSGAASPAPSSIGSSPPPVGNTETAPPSAASPSVSISGKPDLAPPAPPPVASPAVPNCTTTQLDINTASPSSGGGVGHTGVIIIFRNRGSTCLLGGYPGVDGLTANSRAVVHAERTPSGYLGGASSSGAITLRTGQSASTLFEGQNGASAGGPPCPQYQSLVVTPPGETHSVRLPSHYPICYPQVHPVVPGTSGGTHVG